MTRRWLLLPCLILALVSCQAAPAPLRVLFVGNSYTFVNNLPDVLAHLAASTGVRPIEAVMECPGGTRLQQHWESGKAVKLLHESRFDWIVLQDQSEEPGFPDDQLRTDFYPYVADFVTAAQQSGTLPVLMMTWGHKDGDPRNFPGDTYEAMQQRLQQGYEASDRTLHVPIAPAGLAWQRTRRVLPQLELWQGDGSHPSMAGTYLAACVLYQILYNHSVQGASYTAGLDASTARILQQIATHTVDAYVHP